MRNLSRMHFAIIGDKSYVDKDEESPKKSITSFWKSLIKTLGKVGERIEVIAPDNMWIMIFNNVVILCLTIVTAFSETIMCSFNDMDGEKILSDEY